MQQSIQRMSGQVQAMQQEVRELTQLAQQLYQQHAGHFQQTQANAMQNSMMYQLAGNEESSSRLLQYLTDICSEMNHHLRNISQQISSDQNNMGMQGQGMGMNQMGMGGQQGMAAQQGGMGGSMNVGSQQQQKAPEGPIAIDTTHINRANVPGMDQRMTSQLSDPNNNQLPGISDGNAPLNAIASSLNMGTNAHGAQMTAGQAGQQGTQQSNQPQMGAGLQNQASMSSNQQGTQQSNQAQMGAGLQNQASMSSNQQGTQSNQQAAVGTNPLQSQTQSGGASMTSQSPGSEAELKGHSSEYREEPHSMTYPYNRYTT